MIRSFYYQQLSCRARRIYLFRDEYIFELGQAVVIETPQLGNATYLFAKPESMDRFSLLTQTSRKMTFAAIGPMSANGSGSSAGSFTAAIPAVGRRS